MRVQPRVQGCGLGFRALALIQGTERSWSIPAHISTLMDPYKGPCAQNSVCMYIYIYGIYICIFIHTLK